MNNYVQDQCTNNMAAVINSLYVSAVQQWCVPLKILMRTLLACVRRVNILLLTYVYLLHIAKYLILDFSLTVKAAPPECVNMTSQP